MQCNASSKCVLNSDYELHEGEPGFMGVEDPPMSIWEMEVASLCRFIWGAERQWRLMEVVLRIGYNILNVFAFIHNTDGDTFAD